MTLPQIDWNVLGQKHAAPLIEAVKSLFAQGGPFEISAETLTSQTSRPAEEAEALLDALCPPLKKMAVLSCPNCNSILSDDESRLETCPSCHEEYTEHRGVQVSQTFAYEAARSRDVVWVLALHGMNTRGAWQEEFNWRVSTAYGRSVPVAIYKYGLVTSGAIWRPSLRRMVTRLESRIHALLGDAEGNGFTGRPDVIAHSLGTWLIGHALQRNPFLKVGRVILTGSILRPDFDWGTLLARGQVEAVLNHYGSSDFWAGIAHFFIPDSGPSGRIGFNNSADITQACAEGFGHSDFFTSRNLGTVFEETWRPFLIGQTTIDIAAATGTSAWLPMPWIFRATLIPLFLLAICWASAAALLFSCALGIYEACRWLSGT